MEKLAADIQKRYSDELLASQFVEVALGQRTAETLTAEFHQGQGTNQDLRQSS